MEKRAYTLERMLVEMLDSERQDRGIDVYQLGRLAYPDRKEGRKVFANIVQGYTSKIVKGKKRGLSIEDFYRLCMALNLDPIRMFSQAILRLETQTKKTESTAAKEPDTESKQRSKSPIKKAGNADLT